MKPFRIVLIVLVVTIFLIVSLFLVAKNFFSGIFNSNQSNSSFVDNTKLQEGRFDLNTLYQNRRCQGRSTFNITDKDKYSKDWDKKILFTKTIEQVKEVPSGKKFKIETDISRVEYSTHPTGLGSFVCSVRNDLLTKVYFDDILIDSWKIIDATLPDCKKEQYGNTELCKSTRISVENSELYSFQANSAGSYISLSIDKLNSPLFSLPQDQFARTFTKKDYSSNSKKIDEISDYNTILAGVKRNKIEKVYSGYFKNCPDTRGNEACNQSFNWSSSDNASNWTMYSQIQGSNFFSYQIDTGPNGNLNKISEFVALFNDSEEVEQSLIDFKILPNKDAEVKLKPYNNCQTDVTKITTLEKFCLKELYLNYEEKSNRFTAEGIRNLPYKSFGIK